MGITFGIITNGCRNLRDVIYSIILNKIENFQIIVVGGDESYKEYDILHIKFDETIKPMWITRKKNLITENAKYDDIVYMHDYVILDSSWYKNYNSNYDVCCHKILNSDGSRFRDWCLNELYTQTFRNVGMILPNRNMIIPYNHNFSKFMYISGSYFLAKRYVMKEFPLDENLIWGQGEDVFWSMNVLSKYDFTLNDKCQVKFSKYKDVALTHIDARDLEVLKLNYEKMIKFVR